MTFSVKFLEIVSHGAFALLGAWLSWDMGTGQREEFWKVFPFPAAQKEKRKENYPLSHFSMTEIHKIHDRKFTCKFTIKI